MTVTLPIFLMICGLLAFWLLVESRVSWILKITSILLYFTFVVVFYFSMWSFLGWASDEIPGRVGIHSVVIKEPNPYSRSKGAIYLLVESKRDKYENRLLNMFGYKSQRNEPRLFNVPYSRNLHQEMEKNVIPRTREGQVVEGEFSKGGSGGGNGKKGSGKGKGESGDGEGDGEGREGQGDGSESQEQEFQFHVLPPSEIHKK